MRRWICAMLVVLLMGVVLTAQASEVQGEMNAPNPQLHTATKPVSKAPYVNIWGTTVTQNDPGHVIVQVEILWPGPGSITVQEMGLYIQKNNEEPVRSKGPKDYTFTRLTNKFNYNLRTLDSGSIYTVWPYVVMYDEEFTYSSARFTTKGSTVTLSETAIELTVGTTRQLTASSSTAEAIPELTWSSRNTNVATVSSNGLVTGIAPGNTTVTVAAENGVPATCDVTVHKTQGGITIAPNAVTIRKKESFRLEANTLSGLPVSGIAWTSSDPTIAKVSPDGMVTGVKNGSVKITATTQDGSNYSAEALVNVDNISLRLDKTKLTINGSNIEKLQAIVNPNGVNRPVIWSSSNTEVIAVSADGTLMPQRAGKAKITAKISDKIKASCAVTVKVGVGNWTLSKGIDVGEEERVDLNKLISSLDDVSAEDLSWSISKDSLAYREGDTLVITGKAGKQFTLTSGAGTLQQSSCVVKIRKTPTKILVNDYTYHQGRYYKIKVGEEITARLTFEPGGSQTCHNVIWDCKEASIVSITPQEEKVKIVGLKPGFANVLVHSPDGKATYAIVVNVTNDTDEQVVNAALRSPASFDKQMANFCLKSCQMTSESHRSEANKHYSGAGFTFVDFFGYEKRWGDEFRRIRWTPQISFAYRMQPDTNELVCFIAFRGTDFSLKEYDSWATDLTAAANLQGTHIGFANMAENMKKIEPKIPVKVNGTTMMLSQLLDAIENKRTDVRLKFIITGHSLGGALTYPYAETLMERGIKSDDIIVYTFAAPKPYTPLRRNQLQSAFPNAFNVNLTSDKVPVLGVLGGIGDKPGKNFPVNNDDRQAYYISLIKEGKFFWAHDQNVYRTAFAYDMRASN